MGLDAAVEHKARPDDRSLKQQAAANGRKPDAELLDHDPSSRWQYFSELIFFYIDIAIRVCSKRTTSQHKMASETITTSPNKLNLS